MADTVITRPDRFPAGTVVKAYPAAKAERYARDRLAPDGLTETDSATVDSNGVLTLDGLTAGTAYLLHGEVDTGAGAVEVTNAGGVGEDQVETITLRGLNGRSIRGGEWTITTDVGGGDVTTDPLPHNAAAPHVQWELEQLAGVAPGDIGVAGDAGGPYTLAWTGALAETEITTTVDLSGVEGAAKDRFLQVVAN